MGRSFYLFAIAPLLFIAAANCAASEVQPARGRSIALFASEKNMGQWSGSYFDSMQSTIYSPNSCEQALDEQLGAAGFALPKAPFSEEQRLEARKLHAVVERYADMSTIPNDTASRIALAVSPQAEAVIVCGVTVGARKAKRPAPAALCATATCKAVDMKSRRRVATAASERCVPNGEPATSGGAALREACVDVGGMLAQRLGERY